MMRALITWLILLALTEARAANWYITNQVSGSANNGTAWASAWTNPASISWASIAAGDTLHIGGTITNQINIQNQGNATNPITIFFEAGSKLSAPFWSNQTASAAIYDNGYSWLTIDGGGSGIIEATDNGTTNSYGHSGQAIGIEVEQQVSGITVKNLGFKNLYHLTSTNDQNYGGTAVNIQNGFANICISNCWVTWSGNGFFANFSAAGASNFSIVDCAVTNISVGIAIQAGNTGVTCTNVLIGGNVGTGIDKWGGIPAIHCTFVHLVASQSGSWITGAQIVSNYFHGDPGLNATAFVEQEGNVTNLLTCNNLLVMDSMAGSFPGMLYFKGCPGGRAYNNTIVSKVAGSGTGIILFSGTDPHYITNNFLQDLGNTIYLGDAQQVVFSDYNVFAGGGSFSSNFASFGTWVGSGQDTHSSTNYPALSSGTFIPLSSDTVLVTNGINLSAIFLTDLLGNNRPSVGPWTIGAYQYVISGGGGGGSGGPSGLIYAPFLRP